MYKNVVPSIRRRLFNRVATKHVRIGQEQVRSALAMNTFKLCELIQVPSMTGGPEMVAAPSI